MDEPLASARESLLKAIRVTADKVGNQPPPVVKPPQQDVKGIKELTKDLPTEHTVQR